MSVRKDKVQIEVEVNGKKAGQTYKELKKNARDLKRELDALTPGTEKFRRKAEELRSVNTRLRQIQASTRGVSSGMNRARTATGRFGAALKSLGIVALLATIANGFINLIGKSQELSKEQRKTDAQLKQTLLTTGEAAGRNFEQLKKQAGDLQAVTLFGDEQTQQAQSLLLTFTKIRGEVFDRSIPLIQDYATAMATASGESVDLKSASIQVGKALNDPTKGITALSKSGVSFSESQKKVIKSLQDTGDIAGAQAIILGELETQFGGSAQAAAKAAGTFEQTKNKFSDLLEQLGDFFVDFLDFVSPVLDIAIDTLSQYFTILAAVIKEVPPVFAGVKAAVSQAIDNIRASFQIGIVNAKIFAKELDLAISFKSSTKDRLRSELDALKAQKVEFQNAGREVGTAYAEAYGKAVAEQEAADAKKKAEKDAKLAAKQRENAEAEAAEANKRNAAAAKKRAEESEKFFAAEQKRAKAAFEKENLLAEAARIKGEETQAEYDGRLSANKVEFYRKQLALLTAFGKEESNEFLKIQNDLLRLTQRDTSVTAPLDTFTPDEIVSRAPSDSIADIESDQERDAELLRAKFENALIAEQDYEVAALELKAAALDRRIALEQEKGELSNTEFLRLQNDRLEIQREIKGKEVENVKRTEDAKVAIQQAGLQAAGQFLDLAIGFLKEDEDSRKKHAAVIKAFESAKVITNLQTELSAIWKNANASPLNVLAPGAGNILAAAKTGLALGRATLAVSKIQSQKFAGGGYTGMGYGMPDSTGFKAAGIVHEGEWVAPKWMRENPYFGAIIADLEGARVRGYATGGLATVSTAPSGNLAPVLDAPMPGATAGGDYNAAAAKMYAAAEMLSNVTLRAEVVYEDLQSISNEAQQSEINSGI